MDEIIVRVARTLACEERLRILARLVSDGEKSPTALARELDLSPNVLSAHLAKLTAAGLMQRRRSGGWSYCVAKSPYAETTLSGQTLAWLRELLTSPEKTLQHCGLREVRNALSGNASAQLHQLIFESATAFTDLRRLQILRHLLRVRQATDATLRLDLKMSAWAVQRHTDKLLRRGYLSCQVVGDDACYRLAEKCKSLIHARFWEIVRKSWAEKPLRTS